MAEILCLEATSKVRRSIRILLLSTYFRPDVASTGVIMTKLAEEFVAKGHEVTVLTSVPRYDVNRVWPEYSRRLIYSERSGSVRLCRLFTYIDQDKANVFQRILAYGSFNLLSILLGITIPRHDVILVPSPPLSNGIIVDMLGRVSRAPYVYNVQDIWPDVAVRAGVLKIPKWIRRLERLGKCVYRRATRLAVISDGFCSNLLTEGVPEEKIFVISNFVDTDFLIAQPRQNSFRARHGLDGRFAVFFAGNMGFSQGLAIVIDAAARLVDFPEIHFLMVGNGAGREPAERRLAKQGLGNVQFLPFQPHEGLPEMYGSADVCLVPFRRGFTMESVPCKMFSIMAAGKPAISAVDRGSETWSVLERAECGLCVEREGAISMAHAMLHYDRDAQARGEAGRNARGYVEAEFDPSVVAEKYLDVLQSAMKGAPLSGV